MTFQQRAAVLALKHGAYVIAYLEQGDEATAALHSRVAAGLSRIALAAAEAAKTDDE